MVRPRPEDFMDRLVDAGLRVFGTKGYSQSRMSDVAQALGVSQGTLYNYVESKDALFALLIERGADTEPVELPGNLPLRAVPPDRMASRLQTELARCFALPALDRALASGGGGSARAELKEILAELWHVTERTRRHADALERSLPDLPHPVQSVFLTFRRGLFERFAHYVGARTARGHLRAAGSPLIVARFLLENVTLFARHCHRDPDPAIPAGDPATRDGVIDLLAASVVAD